MELEFARLSEGTSKHELECEPSALELHHDTVRFEQSVYAELTVDRSEDDLYVTGVVRHTAIGECVRCLREFDLPIETELQWVIKRVDDSKIDAELEKWAGSDEYLLWPRSLGSFDLSERVRDVLLLGLSMDPVCQADCLGLCPKCGTDLNNGDCDCDRQQTRGPMARLADLLETENRPANKRG